MLVSVLQTIILGELQQWRINNRNREAVGDRLIIVKDHLKTSLMRRKGHLLEDEFYLLYLVGIG
jgi:hypothetical protein